MVLSLLLISSYFGGNGFDGHWFGDSLLGLVSVESGGGSDLDGSLWTGALTSTALAFFLMMFCGFAIGL